MKPTRILRAPYFGRSGKYIACFLDTDIGTLELSQAANMFKHLTRSALYYRIFSAKNTSWKDENIFAEIIPKAKSEAVPNPDAKPLPTRKHRREVESLKDGTWERKEKVWAKYRREETLKRLPSIDEEYNKLLRHHRSVCR